MGLRQSFTGLRHGQGRPSGVRKSIHRGKKLHFAHANLRTHDERSRAKLEASVFIAVLTLPFPTNNAEWKLPRRMHIDERGYHYRVSRARWLRGRILLRFAGDGDRRDR